MQPEYQLRVIVEKAALDEKGAALAAFLEGRTFAALPPDEQGRLTKQLDLMKQYSVILGERIAAFAPQE